MKRKFSRRKFLSAVALLAVPPLAVADSKWLEPTWLKVQRVPLGQGKPTHRLVHFTDVHHKGDRAYLLRVVQKINALSPDLVCFTGDIIEERKFSAEALEILSGIKSPIYGVPGNHDYWGKMPFDGTAKCFEATGGAWLLDRQMVTPDGKFCISGATCLSSKQPPLQTNPKTRNILLMHYPAWVKRLGAANFDLILAGHSHGGQVRLPFYGAVYVPFGVDEYRPGFIPHCLRAALCESGNRLVSVADPVPVSAGDYGLRCLNSGSTRNWILDRLAGMLTLEYLAELLEKNRGAAQTRVKEFAIGGQQFAFNSKPAVMGVINLSPDSWYRESVCLTTESALHRGRVLQAQGADLVDVGAESTLANAARVNDAGQNSKLLPVIRGLREAGILVSVETYQPAVTRASLEAGANVLNLTGADANAELFRMVADHDAAVILCYVQGKNVREVGDFNFTADSVALMQEFFERQIELARRNGVEKILLDPGLGFYYRNLQDSAVRVRHQMTVFLNSFRLRALGYPICHALPHAFEHFGEEVRCAEPFFAVLAALGKTDLFRTHEVPRVRAVLETLGSF